MNTPKITVYVVSHNHEKFLSDAIESVLRQSVEGWELFIIDDGSEDKSREIINLYKGDDRVQIFSTEGIGLPAVCNLALDRANGEYIVRLDGDDLFDENILLVLSNYLDNNVETALVFPDYFLIDEFNEIFAHERRNKIFDSNYVIDIPPNGACTMIRTKVLKEAGGYREDLGAQDGFDMWSKISKKHATGNVNLPLFYYRRHSDNLTNKIHFILNAKRRIKKDSILKVLDKNRPFTAVIPCRKNYDFCEDVWKQKIGGKSILEFGIDECIASDVFDRIVVACDNPDVDSILSKYNDKRLSLHIRNSKDTIRSRKIVPALNKIVREQDPDYNGITVIRYIQSPFVSKESLEEALFTLIMNDADSSTGVEQINHAMYKKHPHGLIRLNDDNDFKTDFDSMYKEANVALAVKNSNFKNGSLTGTRIAHFEIDKKESFVIFSDEDLEVARILFQLREGKNV
ncbi:MAG: glycosyltransferase family 2 protein [Desulfobacterales bacterium]|nr:glycosyltransferase family 2 protein [Desulfobacterales bacterium]